MVGALFILLSLYYNATIPLFESDNEWSHYLYVHNLITKRELPISSTPVELPEFVDQCRSGEALLLDEGAHQFRQPPLYYLLGAVVASWTDTGDLPPLAANPFRVWLPSELGYNFLLHSPEAEAFPYRGAVFSVHLLRTMSGVMGLLGIVAAYLVGLIVFSGRRVLALTTMAVNAFIPQYVFASATINNDILVSALSIWCIYFCFRALVRWPNYWSLMLATLTAGLAVISKLNGLALVGIVGPTLIVVIVRTWRAPSHRSLASVAKLAAVLMLPLLLSGLWFGRNLRLYGRFLEGYQAIQTKVILRDSQLTGLLSLERLARDSAFIFQSFWGRFGWDTLELPGWVIGLLVLVCAVAAIGVILYLFDRRPPPKNRLLVVLALLFVVIVWIASYAKGTEGTLPLGRYMMPAYGMISLLIVLGWQRLLPPRYLKAACWALAGGLLVLALAVPVLVLRPAYAAPRLEATAELRPEEQPLRATFGGFAELLGYRVEPDKAALGSDIRVTLIWRALQPTSNNYVVSIHLLDSDLVPYAWINSHPGRGNFPTSRWQAGDVFRDSYVLAWSEAPWENLPAAGTFKVTMHCAGASNAAATQLPVADAQGNQVGDAVYVGAIKVVPTSIPDGSVDLPQPAYTFGDAIGLEGLSFDPQPRQRNQEVTFQMHWQALGRPAADYTVFAHIVDQEGNQVGGHDQPLTDGYYPSSFWEAGERITHVHRLEIASGLPAGSYQLQMGLYNPTSGERLPIRNADGQELPYVEVPLVTLEG